MLKLGVNIDHVATVREARYRGRLKDEPDPVEAARACITAGAHGITAHLREDRRHIQDRDVQRLKQELSVRFNMEIANIPEIVDMALKIRPDIVCIVPERRLEVTTEGGLDVVPHRRALTDTRRRFNDTGIDVSFFVAPDPDQIHAAADAGAQFVELHTGAFAEQYAEDSHATAELERLISAAKLAHTAGLKVNAGHGLNDRNLPRLFAVPHLVELNIGHNLVSRALLVGMQTAVKEMLGLMADYKG